LKAGDYSPSNTLLHPRRLEPSESHLFGEKKLVTDDSKGRTMDMNCESDCDSEVNNCPLHDDDNDNIQVLS
jgi:hypothetical protein